MEMMQDCVMTVMLDQESSVFVYTRVDFTWSVKNEV